MYKFSKMFVKDSNIKADIHQSRLCMLINAKVTVITNKDSINLEQNKEQSVNNSLCSINVNISVERATIIERSDNMDNEISKNMSEESKEIKPFNFKLELQTKHCKTEDTMVPDIQLSTLQEMIRVELLKNIDVQNIETSRMCVLNEKNLIKHEKEMANNNNITNVNTDSNDFDSTRNSELNNENIKIEPGIQKLESELLHQENIGITDTAHDNIKYSFANIIAMMAQIHGEECDVNMRTNLELSPDINKYKDMDKKHVDDIQPKLTRLVEVMKKKLQNKLNHVSPRANINKQSSETEKKCESVNVEKVIGLSAEHLLTSSEQTAKRAPTEVDTTKPHLYNCAACKAEFTNASDFASHLLKCEFNEPILHKRPKHVKNTCKCTRSAVKKSKIQKLANNSV